MNEALKNSPKLPTNIEEFHFINKKHNYRYERKFTVPNSFCYRIIEQFVKKNTALFREVFHVRQVNNIYFDTAKYNDYFDNVLGVSDRKKIRIRWYGDTFGEIRKPVLEFKIKKGIVNDEFVDTAELPIGIVVYWSPDTQTWDMLGYKETLLR